MDANTRERGHDSVDSATGPTVGILLDLAYLHICAKQFSLPRWEPSALCGAITSALNDRLGLSGTASVKVTQKWAADSSLLGSNTRGARSDGLKKAELDRLRADGFALELHDDKHHAAAQGREVQGAVDVALACRLLWLVFSCII
jgi:hypothetical protein|tara:strand:+ start:116 stop:550 length:435 start_codon:yes stop_codon:yes gene_type:complete